MRHLDLLPRHRAWPLVGGPNGRRIRDRRTEVLGRLRTADPLNGARPHHGVVRSPGRRTPEEISALLEAITEARGGMEQERGSGNEAAYSRARVRMLEALEAYAAGLATRGAPLPHRLQVELT